MMKEMDELKKMDMEELREESKRAWGYYQKVKAVFEAKEKGVIE